jgi:hypothetical protein
MLEGASEMYALLILMGSMSINLWLGALGGRYKHSSCGVMSPLRPSC